MPERSAHWAELVEPRIIEAFAIGYSNDGRRSSMIPDVYGVRSSDSAREDALGVGVLSSEGWNFEDTGRVQYDERKKGFEKRFTHVEFAKGVMAERKFIDDNRHQEVFDNAEALGDSAFTKRETGAASVFTNAFTDSGFNDDGMPIAGPDAVGLCSLVHPRSTEDSATQANEGTLALSAANLSTTRQAHQALADDRGGLLRVISDELMVPPELEDTAIVSIRSSLDPASANNAVNPQVGRYDLKVWHYLTDANAWFLMDSSRRRRALRWYERIKLELNRDGDFDTLQAKWAAYMRYSYGWVDWTWVYGQNPS